MELTDFNPWWKTDEVGKEYVSMKKRDDFEEIAKFIDSRQILIITGLRRTGKTVLMYQLIDHLLKNKVRAKNILYFNLDLMQGGIEEILKKHKELCNTDYRKEKMYVFIDEVQKLGDWQNNIKVFYDLYPQIKFFVSGSSSLFIRKKVRESLAGRSFDFKINPLRFKEYLRLKNKEDLLANASIYANEIRDELKGYIKTGGFPELINETDDFSIKKYIKELIIDKIVYVDIPEVFKIDEPALLQSLISIVSASPGMIVDYESLADDLKRNRKTVSNYLWYLEEAFLLKKVYNFSKNKLTSEKKSKKFYPATTSLAFLYDAEHGKIIESLVLQNSDFKFFYRRGNKEVDFVRVSQEQFVPVEVKAKKVLEKDAKAGLIDFLRKFNVKKGLLITENDAEETSTSSDIQIQQVPLWEWLLGISR